MERKWSQYEIYVHWKLALNTLRYAQSIQRLLISHLITSLSVLCEPHDSIRKPHPIANRTESLVHENSVE